jgi:hypothetical protein
VNTVARDTLELPGADELDELSRADLVFYGVDHSGPSYEGRVFLGNPAAAADTPQDVEHGYAGSFTVFGHAGCFGDEGHCLPDQRFTDAFDVRLPHPLAPLTRTVIATAAVRRAIADPEITEVLVVVVAVMPEDELTAGYDEPLRYDSVRLLTYEG